jgi:hypothetical protein
MKMKPFEIFMIALVILNSGIGQIMNITRSISDDIVEMEFETIKEDVERSEGLGIIECKQFISAQKTASNITTKLNHVEINSIDISGFSEKDNSVYIFINNEILLKVSISTGVVKSIQKIDISSLGSQDNVKNSYAPVISNEKVYYRYNTITDRKMPVSNLAVYSTSDKKLYDINLEPYYPLNFTGRYGLLAGTTGGPTNGGIYVLFDTAGIVYISDNNQYHLLSLNNDFLDGDFRIGLDNHLYGFTTNSKASKLIDFGSNVEGMINNGFRSENIFTNTEEQSSPPMRLIGIDQDGDAYFYNKQNLNGEVLKYSHTTKAFTEFDLPDDIKVNFSANNLVLVQKGELIAFTDVSDSNLKYPFSVIEKCILK